MKKVLDCGFVSHIGIFGDEDRIITVARHSFNSEGNKEKDIKLLENMIKKGHGVPFEHSVFFFKIKCPIFVMRQLVRYRHASISEISGRFVKFEPDFYVPDFPDGQEDLAERIREKSKELYDFYCDLQLFMPKEKARIILPVNFYTSFFWTINTRSLMHFLEQRLSKKTQYETREYAKALAYFLDLSLPNVWRSFKEKTGLDYV